MIELAQHIETLLLENDCVIVPNFVGFVAHYAHATYVNEENLFLPPTRIIGFNSQLKLNDKPFPEIFYFAMSATQSELHTSLMIGDNWKNDVEGAKNVGM